MNFVVFWMVIEIVLFRSIDSINHALKASEVSTHCSSLQTCHMTGHVCTV